LQVTLIKWRYLDRLCVVADILQYLQGVATKLSCYPKPIGSSSWREHCHEIWSWDWNDACWSLCL